MRLVAGHANPDFDSYASSVAAARLYGDGVAVYLGSQNANVRSFHNLHEDLLPFSDLKAVDLDRVTDVVMVDTRDPDRIGELGELVTRTDVDVVIYDHHPPQEGDLACADDRSLEVGATTSILVHELRRAGKVPSPLEASLYLLGIHEDTGSLTYLTTTAFDAEAAAWLMECGADMEVLNQYLSKTLSPAQRALLAQIEDSIDVWVVNGQRIAVGCASAAEYVDSASVLTHYVVEEMGYRVAIGVIAMPGRTQVVARSRVAEVDVGAALALLGGGGHAQAASVGFRDLTVEEALERVHSALSATVRPPVNAGQLMSAPVRTVEPSATMEQAAHLMSRWGHGGMPVVEESLLVGLVTRKDVDKALRHGLGHAPVKGFMRRDVVSVGRDAGLSDLERILGTKGIGRVPVVEDGRIIGIVTRKDVLRARHGSGYLGGPAAGAHPEERATFLRSVESLLPTPARDALHLMGTVARSLDVQAHVVGGFVRDMLLGVANLDIDVVVEGDGIAFAHEVGRRLDARVTVHRRFGTAIITLSKGLHIDVASSRAEYYTRPGALPTVELSTLRQDLFRRDFTINAMAASLSPEGFGAISDPFGGLADLHAGRVRVLHALSFVDDPTRLLRAARFEVRFGFELDQHALQLASQAAEMDLLAEVSGARLREELMDILEEEQPAAVLKRLAGLGALAAVLPSGVSAGGAVDLAEAVLPALAHLQSVGLRGATRVSVLLAALAAQAVPAETERWIRHVRIGRAHAVAIRSVVAVRSSFASLESPRTLRDVHLYHLLIDVEPAALVCLWAQGGAVTRERVEHFVTQLRSVRPAVTGEDLIEMGARPGAAFSAILARCLDDRLEGRAVGREAELANLRRRALSEGLLPSRKDGS